MAEKGDFATTHWSVVRRAADSDVQTARTALEDLCRSYWRPLYSFVRMKGYESHEAEDLTQAFFADLLQRDDIRHANEEMGRFRSFLLGSLKHFMSNEWAKRRAQKRGGGRLHFSMNFADAEIDVASHRADGQAAEKVFERQWALTLLDHVQRLLRMDWESRGKAHQFARLQPFLAGKNKETGLAGIAAELGMTEVAVRVAVHRMRGQFGELLRQEIQSTVDQESEIEDEISRLFEALRK
jgi:RNA polymerase sigma factor (sigma-70 family)